MDPALQADGAFGPGPGPEAGGTVDSRPRVGGCNGASHPIGSAIDGASQVEERFIHFEVSEDVSPEEWQAIADASPFATFFHTPTWLSIFTRIDRAARIRTRIYRFEDGKTAVFPLLERRRIGGLWTSTESSAASCPGGWVSEDPLTPDHAIAIARSMRRDSRNLVWRVNPIDPLGKVLDRFVTIPDTTEILNLRDFADEDSLRAHFHHSTRKQISKGCRAGLTAWVSEQWDEWEEYYRIYEARLEHWGKTTNSRYPMALFRALYEARGPNVSLWVVGRDGKIVGGNLNFYQGRHCVEWHAAYDRALFSCGVRDFLVDHIIRNAWGRGFTWYDFNPSAGFEGTRRFKQSFGTGPLPSNLILWRRGIYRLESTRRALRTIRGLVHRETGRGGADSPAPLPN